MYSRVSLQRSCWHVLSSVMESKTAAPTQSSCPSGTDRFFLGHSRHFVPGYSHKSLRTISRPTVLFAYTFCSKTLTILRTYGTRFRGLSNARLFSYEPGSMISIVTLRTPQ